MPSLYTVEIRTAQWEAMIHWYRRALGLQVAARVVEDRFALLVARDTASNDICRLALLGRDGVAAPPGRVSFSFEAPDLAAAAERLQAAGADFSPPSTNREGFHELKTKDPDGNQIRVFQWPE
ncbi:MAG: VOC family protein [Pirellulales bacterium]